MESQTQPNGVARVPGTRWQTSTNSALNFREIPTSKKGRDLYHVATLVT